MNKPIKHEGFVTDERQAPRPAAPAIEETSGTASTLEEDLADEWPIKVKLLHRAIRNNKNEEVQEITFREPTAGDINRCGNPCRIDQMGDVQIDERKMTLVIATLSGILSPNIERMDPRDWNSCAYRLRGFFLPEVAAW